ncbi:MAG: hypothetical protein WC401_12225 [Bacteroidales bacterium]|jgi:hypothetical protein
MIRQLISAEEIRQHIIHKYIEPARSKNEKGVTIRVGNVQQELGLIGEVSRPGSVYGAMATKIFEKTARVKRLNVVGSGNAPNTKFIFEILP